MSDPAFAKLLEACGLTLEQLDASEDERPCDFVVSEKVAALVERAITDERRRCMEIAERGEAWARAAYLASAEAGDRSATRAFVVQCDGFAKIARLIGEELE